MKRASTWICVAVVALVGVGLGLTADRYRRHNAFHRSEAFKYKRWAELSQLYPHGTQLGVVLDDFGLGPASLATHGAQRSLNVTVPLEIPPTAYRDYRGFTFVFHGADLWTVHPTGPDGAGQAVQLTAVFERKLEALHQR